MNIQDLIIPTGNQAMAHKKIMASALRSQTGGNCGIVSDCPRCLKYLFWRHNLSPSEKTPPQEKRHELSHFFISWTISTSLVPSQDTFFFH